MLVRKHKVSERRACRLVGQHRSTNRYVSTPSDFEGKLVARMVELADEHPKWGYRMICGLLVAEGWPVNKKRIECSWRREGLQVPPVKANEPPRRVRKLDLVAQPVSVSSFPAGWRSALGCVRVTEPASDP